MIDIAFQVAGSILIVGCSLSIFVLAFVLLDASLDCALTKKIKRMLEEDKNG